MRAWEVWIDTGGTFTDCVARAPDGTWRRVKVLSTSALRATVERVVPPSSLDLGLGACLPAGMLAGFRAVLLDPRDDERVVRSHSGDRIELAGPLPAGIRPGIAIELRSPEEAPILALRLATGTPAGEPLPPVSLRLATTLGTNALLERSGAAVALFVTRGFGDLLEIGTQQRPDLFALDVRKPPALHAAVCEVRERISADGSVIEPLEMGGPTDRLEELVGAGVREAAVALLNSHVRPDHERRLAEHLLEAGFRHVSCSSDMSAAEGILARARTAVVDAFLAPTLGDHLARIRAAGVGRLHVLTSAGGLVEGASFRPKDGLLSGPAGGVLGAALAARRSGFERLISFDMGGTSTDVARVDGDFEYAFEHEVGGVSVAAPALAVTAVAAGGGSVCELDGERLRVGPRSAGAHPGPACYGAGGPLTLTDANLLLGRLHPGRFEIPLAPEHAGARADALAAELAAGTGECYDRDALLAGLLEIANERMADAIREVSVRRGYDPAEYPLVAFGGAAAQHACGVAERLGIRTVLVPADAGVLSALGLGRAAIERFAERRVLETLDRIESRLPDLVAELARRAAGAVRAEAGPEAVIAIRRRIVSLRLAGQEATLQVEPEDLASLREAFRARYAEVFGHSPEDRPIEVESVRVVASAAESPDWAAESPGSAAVTDSGAARITGSGPAVAPIGGAPGAASSVREIEPCAPAEPIRPEARPSGWSLAWVGGERRRVSIFQRDDLSVGATLQGPALVFERHTATVIEDGWRAVVDRAGALVLRREEDDFESRRLAPGDNDTAVPAAAPPARSGRSHRPPDRRRRATGDNETSQPARGPHGERLLAFGASVRSHRRPPEAVRVELITNRLSSIAREMGERLRRTALSTNVKERLDFSCALLDADAHLVVNAPHIPVHLGALGLCVRRVREALELEPGDVALTNHPAFGGSHLPDVTVITPVHSRAGRLLGYAASRAHHAEIGGSRPGSMPPFATCLAEEGVAIPPLRLVRAGRADWPALNRLLREAPHPSRAVSENLADVRSALAAGHHGAEALRALATRVGEDELAGATGALQARAERLLRARLESLPRGRREACERLDDGSPLRAALEIANGSITIDLTGSAPRHPGNLNATPAVVRSVVLYVLRLLVGRPLPLNDGLLRPVTLGIPRGSLLDPEFPEDPTAAPAVAGGNVETSQRLADTLLRALGLVACSQGTMNNVIFGDPGFGYYETVCGGCGAGPSFHGASAVHSHMTNTRVTDPEVLERRTPVRLERFAVRRGSGGAGRFRGGDGVVREIRFLAPLSLSILSQHRTEGPFGLEGGERGAPGRQRLVRAAGQVLELGPVDGCEVDPGDRLVLETPGGGGWGLPDPDRPERE